MKRIILSLFFVIGFSFLSFSQDITKGTWFNEEKTAKVQFYLTGEKLFGKIVWLKDPLNKEGKPKSDQFNPDPKSKNNTLIGLVFLKNFEKKSENKWENGKIYDPNNGKTYSSEMHLVNSKLLNVRGFVGISLLGRTSKFTKAD